MADDPNWNCPQMRTTLAMKQAALPGLEAIASASESVAVAAQAVADAYKVTATNAHNALVMLQGDIDLLEEEIAAHCDCETGTGS